MSSNIIPSEALTEWRTWRVGELGELPAPPTAEEVLASPPAEVLPAEQAGQAHEAEPPSEVEAAPPLSYPTAAELEAIHQEAWRAGYDAGLKEGRSQGHNEGHLAGKSAVEAEFSQIWAPIQALADNFSTELNRLEGELADHLLNTAFELAQKLVAAHIELKRDAIRGVLHEALAEWPDELARARMRVNPADFAVVRALLETETPHTTWQWVEDAGIERGGCVIDTKGVSMDLTLERRRDALAAALGLAPQDAGSEDHA